MSGSFLVPMGFAAAAAGGAIVSRFPKYLQVLSCLAVVAAGGWLIHPDSAPMLASLEWPGDQVAGPLWEVAEVLAAV